MCDKIASVCTSFEFVLMSWCACSKISFVCAGVANERSLLCVARSLPPYVRTYVFGVCVQESMSM